MMDKAWVDLIFMLLLLVIVGFPAILLLLLFLTKDHPEEKP